jgi:S1-C subfamily serine protease
LKQFLWTSYKRLLMGLVLMVTMVVTVMPAAALAQTPAALTNQSFVATAVRRVGPAVVRIDTE